jgi:hypothetical protein
MGAMRSRPGRGLESPPIGEAPASSPAFGPKVPWAKPPSGWLLFHGPPGRPMRCPGGRPQRTRPRPPIATSWLVSTWQNVPKQPASFERDAPGPFGPDILHLVARRRADQALVDRRRNERRAALAGAAVLNQPSRVLHVAVHSGQRRAPRVARKRLRQYQRRAIACKGLRTSCAITRTSTMVMSLVGAEIGRRLHRRRPPFSHQPCSSTPRCNHEARQDV